MGKNSGRAELSSVTRARAPAETRDGGHRRASAAHPWPGREGARTRDALTSPSSCTLASAMTLISDPTQLGATGEGLNWAHSWSQTGWRSTHINGQWVWRCKGQIQHGYRPLQTQNWYCISQGSPEKKNKGVVRGREGDADNTRKTSRSI